MRSPLRLLAALVVLTLLAACGDDDDAATGSAGAGRLSGTVTVLAAASLTETFTDIAEAFEAEHEGVDVAVTFDASSALATQILEGAPADVFASADIANMDKVTDAGLAGEAVVFATNALQIVIAEGNPKGISSLADLTTGDLTVALCAPEVPCGRYAAGAFERAGLDVPSASQEENVRGVLTKVSLGEADAGIVYVTDVLTGEHVEGVDLPAEHQVPASYPAATLTDAPNPTAATAFLAFLTGEDAQAILRDAGFGAP